MHGQEDRADADRFRHQHGHGHGATAGADPGQGPSLQAGSEGILRVDLQARPRMLLAQAGHLAGPRQGVPVAQDPAHGEHQRIAGIRRFSQPQRRLGPEPRPTRGGGETSPRRVVQPGLAPAGHGAGGERPLLGPMRRQQPMTQATHVADAPGGERHQLGMDLRRRAIGELAAEAQPAAQFGEDRPIGPRLAGGLAKGRAEGDPPLGIGHHAALLAPLGRRQHQMGHRLGFGAGVGLTEHHQRHPRHRRPHPLQRGQAHQGIGGRHPPQRKVVPLHRLDLVPNRQAGLGVDGAGLKPPMALHRGAMVGIGNAAVSRQQLGQATGLPAPHGIGLTGERKGTGPGAANLGRHQMQVDQAAHRGAALLALVHPHRPEAEHGGTLSPPGRQLTQLVWGNGTHRRHPLRRPGSPQGGQGGEALRGGGNETRVEGRLLLQQMADAVQQHQIGAGADRQVQIGGGAGGGGARVHHDDPQPLALLALALQQPLEQHRMAVRSVGADQQHQIGQVEVVVAAGGTVGAEAAGIARHRRAHAQP